MLHLHHVNAPSFCGEDEVMNGIEERVHTCVSVTANTTVAMLPARVFQVLITSQFPARMYKSAEKLRHLREARTDWYDIRMSLGDSAAVPFGFLDHSQSKLLPNEIHEGVVTRERKITNLFQRVLRCVWVSVCLPACLPRGGLSAHLRQQSKPSTLRELQPRRCRS